jgi:hypothetical protein
MKYCNFCLNKSLVCSLVLKIFFSDISSNLSIIWLSVNTSETLTPKLFARLINCSLVIVFNLAGSPLHKKLVTLGYDFNFI